MIDGLGRRIVAGIKWAVIYKLTGQLISWVSTLWVVRMLSPEDYGLNAMLEAPFDFAMLFATWGLYVALIKGQKIETRELSAVFGFMLLINALAFVVFQLLANHIAGYFREERLTTLVQAISIIFLLVPFRIIPNALLDQQLKFKKRAQVDLAASSIGSLTAVLLALAGAGVWALLASVLVNYLVRAIVLAIIHPWFVIPSLRFGEAKGTLVTGGKVLISGVLLVITGKAVEIIAGPVVGAQTLGVFAVAAQLSMIPLSRILPIINQTLYPAFVHIRNDPERVKEYSLKTIQFTALAIMPSAAGLFLIADLIIDTLFGARWGGLKEIFPVLCLLLPVVMLRNLLSANLVALGKTNLQLMLNGVLLIIAILFCFALRDLGLDGLVWISIGSAMTSTMMVFVFCRAHLGITLSDLMISIKPAIVCALIMGLVVSAVQQTHLLAPHSILLAIFVSAGVIAYALALRLLYPDIFREMISAVRA